MASNIDSKDATPASTGTGEHSLEVKPAALSKPAQDASSSNAGISAGKGVSQMTTSVLKGTLVDVPLALTEGLHNLPELYGDKVRKHNKITDWKSGTAEAGKVWTLLAFH